MDMGCFKVIPGFEKWCVTQEGDIHEVGTGKRVRTSMYGDRKFASYPTDITTRLLAVHRAVALAWVKNDDPELKTVVNHIDGDPLNNRAYNLEWTTMSGNNYHAINTGLRPDNKPCKIRDFYTGEVREFPSIRQACEFMKIRVDTAMHTLRPARFGSLILGQYEFRLLDDPEPFFYENRPYIVSPSRYMVEVTEEDGRKRCFFKNGEFLQCYQLYRCPDGKSLPALLKYAEKLYPGKRFKLRDGVEEAKSRARPHEAKRTSVSLFPVIARKGDVKIEFKSLSAAAGYFGVDRSVIKLRLSDSESTYLGWSFDGQPISVPIKRLRDDKTDTPMSPLTDISSTKPS